MNVLDKKSTKSQSRKLNKSTAERAGLITDKKVINSLGKDNKTELLSYENNLGNQQSARVLELLHPETVQ